MFSNGFDRKDAIFVIVALYVAQPFDSTLLIDNTVNYIGGIGWRLSSFSQTGREGI